MIPDREHLLFKATEDYSHGVRSVDPVQCDNRTSADGERRNSSILVWLRGHRVVFVNEPAKDVVTMHDLQRGGDVQAFARHRYLKIDASVRALLVVMVDVLRKDPFEMAMAQNEQPIEAFGANRPYPAFRESVGPRRSDWRLDHSDAFGTEHLVKSGGELGVPVSDEELEGATSVRQITDQIASNLSDERAGRMISNTENMYFSRRQLDDEEYIELLEKHRVHCEEVGGQYALHLRTKELRPCRPAPRCRPEAVSTQDPSDRTG
jgi:hypothetical protein